MLYKVGTEKELVAIKGKIQNKLYQAVLAVVKILDDNYGSERDVDQGDGGFALIVENVQDLATLTTWHIRLDMNAHDGLNLVRCEARDYLNVFYLMNNEFGVNVFLPKAIAPKAMLDELDFFKLERK